MTVTVAVGGFYGDEGKGKIVAFLSLKDSHSLAAVSYTHLRAHET